MNNKYTVRWRDAERWGLEERFLWRRPVATTRQRMRKRFAAWRAMARLPFSTFPFAEQVIASLSAQILLEEDARVLALIDRMVSEGTLG